jgi:hypothetical protein
MKPFTSFYQRWRTVAPRFQDGLLQASPLEDFTTEILAALIKKEPEPFLAFLRTKRILPTASPSRIVVQTQERITVGKLDMVLTVEYPTGAKCVFWFEMKIEAPFGIGQLEKIRTRSLNPFA